MFEEKFIASIFSRIAPKYDLMNDVMSFSLHRHWKKELCSYVKNLNAKILDVACGSGDISFELYRRGQKLALQPKIVLSDVNAQMLQLAKDRAINQNMIDVFEFVQADACALPFEDNSFDYYTIAFGIRNIVEIEQALSEAYRVLKPGARFLCLEFSKPSMPIFKNFYKIYSEKIIPKMGKWIANDQQAYQYLVDSIRAFPDQNIFIAMMQRAGFKFSYCKNLSFSIASIYVGYKE